VVAESKNGNGAWQLLQPSALANLQNLLFASRVIVEGAFAGRHRSPYKGSAAEFIDYREYNPGDEIRTIDWKAYARSDRYFIKLFQTETDMNGYLLVDCSASMGYGGPAYERLFGKDTVSKFDYAKHLAAAISFLLVQQGDRVGLTLFDDRIRTHRPRRHVSASVYAAGCDDQAGTRETDVACRYVARRLYAYQTPRPVNRRVGFSR